MRRTSDYIEHFLFFSFFFSAAGLKICAITARIKKYKSIIKKKKKRHDQIALSVKNKSSTIEVLISEALIDSSPKP